VRLFVGLPVPPSPAFGAVAAELAAEARVRTVPPGSWHVTLRFLGEVLDPAPVAAALDAAARGRHPIPCVVEGVGTFPDKGFPPHKRARVAWAGVRADGLDALASAVREATARLGEPPEDRPFVAHVTLARLPRPADLRRFVSRHEGTLFSQGVLDRVVLFRSTPGPGGSHHEPLHAARLGA
jgi:2'-5' RNA ligase